MNFSSPNQKSNSIDIMLNIPYSYITEAIYIYIYIYIVLTQNDLKSACFSFLTPLDFQPGAD